MAFKIRKKINKDVVTCYYLRKKHKKYIFNDEMY